MRLLFRNTEQTATNQPVFRINDRAYASSRTQRKQEDPVMFNRILTANCFGLALFSGLLTSVLLVVAALGQAVEHTQAFL